MVSQQAGSTTPGRFPLCPHAHKTKYLYANILTFYITLTIRQQRLGHRRADRQSGGAGAMRPSLLLYVAPGQPEGRQRRRVPAPAQRGPPDGTRGRRGRGRPVGENGIAVTARLIQFGHLRWCRFVEVEFAVPCDNTFFSSSGAKVARKKDKVGRGCNMVGRSGYLYCHSGVGDTEAISVSLCIWCRVLGH